ncbi:MAG: alpha/beta fold hydrolase [Gammaproteobacteria bacterium]
MAFVHGWGFGPEVWRSILPDFSDFHPVLWHLPGYQHTQSCAISAQDYAIDADAMIGIGWSLGGQHLLQLVARQPKRFRAVVLVATNVQFVSTTQWLHGVAAEAISQWQNRVAVNPQTALRRFAHLCVHGAENADHTHSLLEECLRRQTPPSQQTLQAGLESLATAQFLPEFRQLKTPTLLIGGEVDSLVPNAAFRAMQEMNPAIAVEIIAGAGHAPFLSHPEIFRKRIREFLA